MSKIHRITEQVSIPYLGGKLLEDVEALDSVLIVYHFKDGTTKIGWSQMTNGELAYAAAAMQMTVNASLFEEE